MLKILKSDECKLAAEIIHSGGLVAFPTETVYGLGADAFNANAVARVYSEKGRPGDNPLILHIANAEDFNKLAHNPPKYASALIKAFWPGALTLVVQKSPDLPEWLGGHPMGKTATVGVRMCANPIANTFIKAAGIIAAPSANKAGRPSPTTLAHVIEDFGEADGIAAIDGGSTAVGLESTVVDITGKEPVILRHGAVTQEALRELVSLEKYTEATDTPRSPGMKYRHYAPRAEMTILSGTPENIASYVQKYATSTTIALVNKTIAPFLDASAITTLILGDNKEAIARNLFSYLRECDRLGAQRIFAQAVDTEGLGAAIMDRMTKAAEGRIIYV